MKKRIMLVIAAATLSLAACSNATTNSGTTDAQTVSTQAHQQKTAAIAGFYYTANAGSISKIDAATNKVVKTIKIDGSVHNVQISTDGKTLGATVVPSMGHGEHADMVMNGLAMFYDTASGELIKKVEVGEHPAHIVFTEDGKYVLVTNNEGNDVSVLDGKTYESVEKIAVGNGPHGFRISNDSKFAYIANMGEDTVSVIDLQTLKEIKKMTVGETPVTTGITSDGKTFLVPLNAENAVAVVNIATDEVEKIPVGAGPAQVYIQTDNKYAFVANQGTENEPSHSVSKIDLNTKQVVATIETGDGAHGVVTSADNRFVYVTNMYANTVSVINNETNKVIATVSVDEEPNGITFQKEE